MDAWAIGGLVFNMLLKYGPDAIRMVHQVAHDLQQHPDPIVKSVADALHSALHGEDPPTGAR